MASRRALSLLLRGRSISSPRATSFPAPLAGALCAHVRELSFAAGPVPAGAAPGAAPTGDRGRSPAIAAGAQGLPAQQQRSLASSIAAEAAPEAASAASAAADYAVAHPPRNDWTREEVQAVFDSPLMDLIFHGARVHRAAHHFREVQQCTLLSIKTGGCAEDCSYCSQSSKYKTGVKAERLAPEDDVLKAAREAKEAGSTRFCMGAAWRSTAGRKTDFNKILNYVSSIRSMGMEVCCTLGMLSQEQALQLRAAGLTAYNHNLDTSREYYPNVITTRTYDDRLETLENVRQAGINVCSGGILGLGEEEQDRVGLFHTLATLPEHPESVPINTLVAVEGTPLEKQEPVSVWELVRAIGTARIIMPRSIVRLSAGRINLSRPEQALCFLAGANSIFTGDRLLTTPNNAKSKDDEMFEVLGLIPMPSFRFETAGAKQAAASS